MTPFDYLGRLLDWAYAKHWSIDFLVTTLILVIALAVEVAINQDGKSTPSPTDPAVRDAAATAPHESKSGASAPPARAQLGA